MVQIVISRVGPKWNVPMNIEQSCPTQVGKGRNFLELLIDFVFRHGCIEFFVLRDFAHLAVDNGLFGVPNE